jgi:hypothetical protein
MTADDTPTPDWTAPARYPELHSINLEADGLYRTCQADLVFLERYEGWQELGRGRQGTVVRTHCRALDAPVALKLIGQMAGGDPLRVNAEAALLARITHPCVVRTYAAFCRGPLTWIEMELIDGLTLEHEIGRQREADEPWPLARQLEIAWAASEGLAAVHAAGVIHHDIKAANILLPASGRPAAKVVDFGVARLREASVAPGRRAFVPGTPRYSAPEVISVGQTSPASDVYALGVTLFELFTRGTHPYALREDTPVGAVLNAHLAKAPVPLLALAPQLDERAADLVMRALDKRPERRPSARELADGLRAVVPWPYAVEVVEALRAERARARGTRVARRLAIVGVSMLMLMGAFAAWRQWRGRPSATSTAVAEIQQVVPPPVAARVAPPAARLHVSWAAPDVVGVANPGTLDLVDVTVRVAGVAYPLGAIAVDEEAWIFTTGEGTVTVEGVTVDGTRVVAVLS